MIDENGRRRRWRRKDTNPEVKDGFAQFHAAATPEEVDEANDRVKRECPVPKPGGILGEWMGFHKTDGLESRPTR